MAFSPEIAPLERFACSTARSLVAAIEGDKVRLSADAANAELFEEEDGRTRH